MTASERPSRRPRRPRAEKRFAEIIGRHQFLIRRATLALFASRLVLAAIPLQLNFFLDPLIAREPIAMLGMIISPAGILAFFIFIGVLVAIVRGVADYVFVSAAARCGHSVVAELRTAMYEHVLRLPVSYLDRRSVGKVLLRFIGDSDALRTWVARRAPMVRVDRIVLLVLVIVMFVVDWRLALVALTPLPIVWFVARIMSARLRQLTRTARTKQANFTGTLGTMLGLIRQAKWLDRNRSNRRNMRETVTEVAELNIRRDRQGAVLQGVGQFFAFLSVPLLLLVGVQLAWNNSITLGTCLAFVWLTAHAAVILHRLNAAVVIREKAGVSKERILRLLERTAERGRSARLPKFRAKGRLLQFENVVVDQTATTRDPVTMALNGPGLCRLDKGIDVSTTAQLVLGLKQPLQGRVFLDNQNVAELRIDSVRKQVGWIVEQPLILEGTIRENIHAACPRVDVTSLEERIARLLGTAELSWLDRVTTGAAVGLSRDDLLVISILRAATARPKFLFVELLPDDGHAHDVLVRVLDALKSSALIVVPSDFVARDSVGETKRSASVHPVAVADQALARLHSGA